MLCRMHDPKDFQGTKKDNEITIFKSTNFGDDEDRAITKNDGTPTYFANDIAYHVRLAELAMEKDALQGMIMGH